MHNSYSNRAYMHGYCSMCICYFINFVRTFFSLSSPCTTNELSFPLLIFFFLKYTQTNTPTSTHKQTHTDKPIERQIEARGSWSVLDRSSWVLTSAWSELVGLDRCLTGARGSWSLLDWNSSWSMFVEQSELVGLLLERSSWVLIGAWLELVGLDRCLTGAHLDRCLWNDRSAWVFCLNEAWPRWVLPDRS